MNRSHTTTRRRPLRRAFTLLEIIVVVTIIALLATLVAPKLLQNIGKSKQKIAQAEVAWRRRDVAALEAVLPHLSTVAADTPWPMAYTYFTAVLKNDPEGIQAGLDEVRAGEFPTLVRRRMEDARVMIPVEEEAPAGPVIDGPKALLALAVAALGGLILMLGLRRAQS